MMCKLITTPELHTRTDSELSALFRKVVQELVQSKANTAKRRNALASLENISRETRVRYAKRFTPPGF
jgi:hypothetical protein